MLRVYLSYTQADKNYLLALRRWLRPLEQKYDLHVWHIPVAQANDKQPYYWDAMLNELEHAHLYLFLTSAQSLKDERIHREELPRALRHQAQHGPSLVQLYRIPLSDAHGGSALDRLPILGAAKQIDDWQSDLVGYEFLTKDIEKVVSDLERSWREESIRTGQEFVFPTVASPAPPARLQPLPGWTGLAFLMAVFYIVTSIYFQECAPRRYHGLPPNAKVPASQWETPYPRENPITPPQPVPPRPE